VADKRTPFSQAEKKGVELNREQLEALAELVNEELARDSIGVKY